MHISPRYHLRWIVAALVALSGCGGSSTEPSNSPPQPPPQDTTPVVTPPSDTTTPAPDTVFTLTIVTAPTSVQVATSDSVAVKLTDATGALVANREVTFTVVDAGSTVSPGTVSTNAQGIATTHWTMGTVASGYTLSAIAPHVSAPATITISATPGPTVAYVIGSKFVFIDDYNPPLGLRTSDAYGNTDIVQNAEQICTPRVPGLIRVSNDGSVSKLDVGQTMVVCGTSNTKFDSALVTALPSRALWLGGVPDSFTVSPNATLRVPISIAEAQMPQAIGSITFTVSWDPAQLSYVSQELFFSDQIVVNTNDVANGHMTVAYASSSGMSFGNVMAISLRASSAVGRVSSVSVSVSECAQLGTFTNVLTKMIGASFPLVIK